MCVLVVGWLPLFGWSKMYVVGCALVVVGRTLLCFGCWLVSGV